MRTRPWCLVIAVFLMSWVVLGTGTARATTYTCGQFGDTGGNLFDGFKLDSYSPDYGGYFEGTSANIKVAADGTYCTTDSSAFNFVASYTMIANGNAHGWVQIGYVRSPGISNRIFTQIWNGSGTVPNPIYYSSVSVGSTYHFWEQFDAACFCIHANYGTTRVASTSFNPINSWTTQPWQPQFASEMDWAETQVSGTPGYPTVFDGLQFQDYYTDNFGNAPCNLTWYNQSSLWTASHPSCDRYYIYNS